MRKKGNRRIRVYHLLQYWPVEHKRTGERVWASPTYIVSPRIAALRRYAKRHHMTDITGMSQTEMRNTFAHTAGAGYTIERTVVTLLPGRTTLGEFDGFRVLKPARIIGIRKNRPSVRLK